MRKELKLLRDYMEEEGVDVFVVPSSDPHQGEYVSSHFNSRMWLSGFTGSAGTVVVTRDKAGLFTDGRYFIQAEKELKGSGIDLFKMGIEGTPPFERWIYENVKDGGTIGFDGRLISQLAFMELDKYYSRKKVSYKIGGDPFSKIWSDRPSISKEKIYNLPLNYSGVSRVEKIDKVREKMKKYTGEIYLLSTLDDIAWILNLRGKDVENNPFFYSYVSVDSVKTTLFVDIEKVDAELIKKLSGDGVEVREYNEVEGYLKENKNKKIVCDPSKTSRALFSIMNEPIPIERDIVVEMKAIKNKVEKENLREAYIRDSVALIKFFTYIEENRVEGVDEFTLEKTLEDFRKEDKEYVDRSFHPIIAFGDHGAMMHYRASKEGAYNLKKDGLLLVDSGGHYKIGSTDITRTMVLGEVDEKVKKDFTYALQGLIELSTTIFLKGTTGYVLDVISRKPLWKQGLDYKCGTGHGVGYFLSIHEGPCSFSPRPGRSDNPLKKDMLITIEPGVYKDGEYGIRHENTVLVKEHLKVGVDEFYSFETVTFFPFDTRGIDVDVLTDDQREWLNNYHSNVYEILKDRVVGKELEWLKKRTQKI